MCSCALQITPILEKLEITEELVIIQTKWHWLVKNALFAVLMSSNLTVDFSYVKVLVFPSLPLQSTFYKQN